jgi:hypothetical protein
LKMCPNSGISKQQKQIKIIFKRKLRGDRIRVTLVTVQSSRLLSKNIKIRIYKTIILPVVLYECESWTLILREGHRLKVLRTGC